MPLHLEPDVEVGRVIEFKRSSRAAVDRMRRQIALSVAAFDEDAALDAVTAAGAMAATLWQATHPTDAMAAALRQEPGLSHLSAAAEFEPTLTRLLAATLTGLAAGQGPA